MKIPEGYEDKVIIQGEFFIELDFGWSQPTVEEADRFAAAGFIVTAIRSPGLYGGEAFTVTLQDIRATLRSSMINNPDKWAP